MILLCFSEHDVNRQLRDPGSGSSDDDGSQSGNSRYGRADSENDESASSANEGDNEGEATDEDESHDDESHDEDEVEEDLGQDEDDNDNPDDDPLYNGARITFRESLLAILTFILTHKLTGLAVSDLLSLIEMHCGPDNLCLRSNYMFKKYFRMIGKNLIMCCYYCSNCQVPLQRQDSICRECAGQHDVAYFIQFPISDQLKSLFAKPGFYEALQFRFNRIKKNEANLEDVYDASIYQECMQTGFLANPNNISFFAYFDGMALFKKSVFSIWPLYLTINELKYSQRTKKENVVLAGIWFGKTKPNPNLFLQPISDSLSNLENDGTDVSLHNGQNINVKAKLIGAVGDMPAKAIFMRLKHYNGAFSCFYCMAEGGRFDLENRYHNTLQVFPYSRNLELRNCNNMIEFARQAVIARRADPKASVYGVKGPSLLLNMLPNKVFCMGADIMHGVFLGVQKTLLNLWFDPQYSNQPFSISGMTAIVDRRLKSIRPPASFYKLPKTIKKELAHMKASDFKIFFFYYSLPVLLGILPDNYWFHHSKIVTAIALLSKDSVSMFDLDQAEELIHAYVSEFEELYHLRYLTLTFHQLLHFPLVTRNLGPMWVYSCFFYESLNGQFAQLVHGSRYVALQIASTCSILLNLPVMISSMNPGRAKELCLKFQGSLKNYAKVTEIINNSAGVVGKLRAYPVPMAIRRLVQDTFNIVGGRFWYFPRLKINNIVYSSESYQRAQKTLSCFACLHHEEIPYLCKIKSFLKWSSCQDICPVPCENNCPKMYICIVRIYDRVPWKIHEAPQNISLFYLDQVESLHQTRAFLITSINAPCLCMSVGGRLYLSLPVNNLEVE